MVVHRVGDRRRVARKVRLGRERDCARGRVHRPSAFARNHQRIAWIVRAHDLHGGRIDHVARGVVGQHGHGDRRVGGVVQQGVVAGDRHVVDGNGGLV